MSLNRLRERHDAAYLRPDCTLRREVDGTAFRLLGVGISQLADEAACDPVGLVDDGAAKRAAAERAIDRVRARFGGEALGKGRGRRGVAARSSR